MREISETDKSETPSSLLHSTVRVQSLLIRLFLQPLGNVMSSLYPQADIWYENQEEQEQSSNTST